MTLSFDPGDDFAEVTDALEPVTLTRQGSSTTSEVTGALRRVLTTAEARASQGNFTTSDVAWHLPGDEPDAPPRLGDVIVDADGRRWTVLAVQQTTLGGRRRCVCRDLAIVHKLDAYVDIEKATYAKGAGGAEEPTWHTWKTGLRARIQPVEAEVDDAHQQRVTSAKYTVFLADAVTLDHTHRIKGPDATVYRVTGYRKADRIDALTEIDVIRVD